MYIDTGPPSPVILTLNNSNFSDTTPEIRFNITDNLAPTINYTFYVDDSIDVSENATNGINRTDNLSALGDGHHIIILEATDLAGNKQNSSFINITIDTTAPSIVIDFPLEGEPYGYGIDLLTTISDVGVGVDTVTYTLANDTVTYLKNGTLNASDTFDDFWNSTLHVDETVEFMFINFTVTANDTLGNTATAVRRFVVDNRRPSINFLYPNGIDLNRNFNLSIVVTNRNLTESTINITNSTGHLLYNNSNRSIFQTQFNWTDFINISNVSKFPEGVYNITVFAVDEVANNRTSHIFFRIDRTFPNITLLFPPPGFNTTLSTVEFNFTVRDSLDPHLSCNLTLDGAVVASNINATNNTVVNVTVENIGTATHFWNVSCIDDAGNLNISETRNFTVDDSPPVITLLRPTNNSFNSSSIMMFYYRPFDNYTSISNCSLYLDGVLNQTNNTILDNATNNFTVYGLNEARYEWTVNCTDFVGNEGFNDTVRALYIDQTPPNATFITNNGTWFNDPTPDIFFNITDNFDDFLNYTIYVDGILDVIGNVANGTQTSDTLSTLADGRHTLVIEAYDNAYNRLNSSNITIIIDTVLPNVTILGPENGSNFSTQDITFFFNVTDHLDPLLNCNITINDVVNVSNIFAINATNTSQVINDFNVGFYNVSVSCQDNASNVGFSGFHYFNITPPDLEISTVDITFNVTTFQEDLNFTVFANVTNIGDGPVTNGLVQFFKGSSFATATQINGNFTLNLTRGQNKTVNVTTTVGIGNTYIFVILDPNGDITEIDEANNLANASINISLYSIISGNISGSLLLESIANSTIFSWEATDATIGTVYVTDTDSSITWTNLTALGRNITGGNASDDWK